MVKGTVLDKSKINFVENVQIISTGGAMTFTDSLGKYKIAATPGDSLFYVYNNKPTQKFAVGSISNTEQFDISIQVDVKSKYGILKEVIVYSKSHQQDSIENRASYADVFNYSKPGISTSVVPGGGVGLDLNEFINIFRFRRNRSLRAFQKRLEAEEQDKFIDYKFNKKAIKRITQLEDEQLTDFMNWYKPSYDFLATCTEVEFTNYILKSLSHYKKTSRLPVKQSIP